MVQDFIRRTMEEYRDAKDYKFVSFSDDTSGTTQTVWTPASGKTVRLACLIISVDGACKLEFKWGTTTFTHLELEARRSMPLFLPYDIKGGVDVALNAYLLADSGTVNAYITAVGDEE